MDSGLKELLAIMGAIVVGSLVVGLTVYTCTHIRNQQRLQCVQMVGSVEKCKDLLN